MLDFGAVARLPARVPGTIGRLSRLAIDGDAQSVLEGLRAEGFVRPHVTVDAQGILDYLSPVLEPLRSETFRFTRSWMRARGGPARRSAQ